MVSFDSFKEVFHHLTSQFYACLLVMLGIWLQIYHPNMGVGHDLVGGGLILFQATPPRAVGKMDIKNSEVEVNHA